MDKFYYVACDSAAAPHVNFNRYDVDSFIISKDNIVTSAFCKSSRALSGGYSPRVTIGQALPDLYKDCEVSEKEFYQHKSDWEDWE